SSGKEAVAGYTPTNPAKHSAGLRNGQRLTGPVSRKSHRVLEVERDIGDQRHLTHEKDRSAKARRQKTPDIERYAIFCHREMSRPRCHVALFRFAPQGRKNKSKKEMDDPEGGQGATPTANQH